MVNHPCQGCPTRPDHGVIACPVAASVLNKGRCRRVKAMASLDATANLARVWMRRWNVAKGNGDQRILRFLKWQSANPERLAAVLAGLAPSEQVKSLASPLVVRVRHSANGGGDAEPDAHIDAIASLAQRAWERGNKATASDGNAGRTRARAKRGT